MAGAFNTTLVTDIKLKLPKLNHIVEKTPKSHLMDKISNYNLILGRDMWHELGTIFNFEYKTITWQEDSTSMKPSNCTAKNALQLKKAN